MSQQKLSSVPEYDIIVCGGGPAGVGAAIATARKGAKTLLVEQLGHVGGMPASADLVAFCDTMGGPVYDELVDRLIGIGAAHYKYEPEEHHSPGRLRFNAEELKVLLMKMLQEAGVEVRLHTVAHEAHIAGGKTVDGIYIADKSGSRLIKAGLVIDATADGDIAASAGADFLKGDPEDGRIQHVNFRYSLGGVDKETFTKHGPQPEELEKLFSDAIKTGEIHPPDNLFSPPANCFPFNPETGRLCLEYWEIENVDPADPVAVSRTLTQCQAAVFELLKFCRENLPGYDNAKIAHLPATLGTRESRRIIGEYILTREDVISARKFKDAVARADFWIDLHDSPPGMDFTKCDKAYKRNTRPSPGDWADIPIGCLKPKGFQGILVAGRCISADREAHGVTRMIPTCFYTGSAAGAAAEEIINKQ